MRPHAEWIEAARLALAGGEFDAQYAQGMLLTQEQLMAFALNKEAVA